MKIFFTKKFLLPLALIFGLILGLTVDNLWGPPQEDVNFVQECASLNGQQFNLDTIKSLNGFCYSSIDGVQPCTEKLVVDHKSVISTIKREEEKGNIKYGQHIGSSERSFDVRQKHRFDDTWVCSIKEFDPVIRAYPNFFYD